MKKLFLYGMLASAIPSFAYSKTTLEASQLDKITAGYSVAYASLTSSSTSAGGLSSTTTGSLYGFATNVSSTSSVGSVNISTFTNSAYTKSNGSIFVRSQ